MINITLEDIIPKKLSLLVGIPLGIIFAPVGLLYCTIAIIHAGLFLKLPFKEYAKDMPFMIIRPGFYVGIILLFIFMFLWNVPENVKYKRDRQVEDKLVKKKYTQCIFWLTVVGISPHDYEVNVYTSGEETIGRVIIRGASHAEKDAIEEQKVYLPKRIHLECV